MHIRLHTRGSFLERDDSEQGCCILQTNDTGKCKIGFLRCGNGVVVITTFYGSSLSLYPAHYAVRCRFYVLTSSLPCLPSLPYQACRRPFLQAPTSPLRRRHKPRKW